MNFLDADSANTNNVILIYSRRSDPKTNYNVSGGWNREHLWPDSYGIDGHQPMYSDLHNLRPEDRSVNSARFFKADHAVIIPLTVREILDEQMARKLA